MALCRLRGRVTRVAVRMWWARGEVEGEVERGEREWRRGRLGCYPQACDDEGGRVVEITANLHVMVGLKVQARGESLRNRKSGDPNRLNGDGG